MNALIRPATVRDFEAVTALLAELGRPQVAPADMEAARQVYERHTGRPDTASLVAEVDGRVIGFMSLEFRERLNRTTPQAWIPDLIVTESHRGIGAGRALLLRGVELARDRGCWSVTLESGNERAAAHQLYLSAGMQDLGKYFLIDLD
jgi:GNAT superfamily N-acetyltransferase